MTDFIKAVTSAGVKQPEIIAFLRNGKQIRFTRRMLELLKGDPEIIEIIDADTGELIYTA